MNLAEVYREDTYTPQERWLASQECLLEVWARQMCRDLQESNHGFACRWPFLCSNKVMTQPILTALDGLDDCFCLSTAAKPSAPTEVINSLRIHERQAHTSIRAAAIWRPGLAMCMPR